MERWIIYINIVDTDVDDEVTGYMHVMIIQ